MDVPDVSYARSGDVAIAYQVVGEGPTDVVFVRGTLADVMAGAAPPRSGGRPVVFSPFGLGVLDLAVARLVLAHAQANGSGVRVPSFLPAFTG